jgi:MFS transporter, DHA1 family, multidrug resistance protein
VAGQELAHWKRNLYSVWVVVFISLMGANLVFPFMPFFIQEDLGIDDPGEAAFWAGANATAMGISMFVFSPIWGSLADRYGRRSMLMRSVAAGVVLIGLQGVCTNVYQLMVLRALQGAFMGTVGAANALVASSVPQREVAYSMGLLQTSRYTSQTVGPVIGGLLAAFVGFRETFLLTAALYGIGVLLIVFFVEDDREAVRAEREREGEGEGSGGTEGRAARHGGSSTERPSSGRLRRDLAAVAAVPALMLMIIIYYFLFASNAFVRPVIPLVLQDIGQGSIEVFSGLLFAVLAVASTVASLWVGRRSSARFRLPLAMCIIGAGLALLPVAVVESYVTLLLVMAGFGLFSGGMMALTNGLIALLSPAGRQGSAFGMASSSQALAMATAPLAGGAAASVFGVRAVFPIAAAILVAVGVAAWALVREPQREEERAAVEATPAG